MGCDGKKALFCCLCQALKSNTIDSQFETKACIGSSISCLNTATKHWTTDPVKVCLRRDRSAPERSEQTQTKSRGKESYNDDL